MIAFNRTERLRWGALDLPLLGVTADWDQTKVEPPLAWSLAIDPDRLWFVASHARPACLHPKSRPGQFQPELWKYDVAELFLANPTSGHYLEFNLAPNGAWWSCGFSAPRTRLKPKDEPFPEAEAFGDLAPDGTWVAALSLPIVHLQRMIDFGSATHANATFIVGSPDQRFLTVAPLPGSEPDFHQPGSFPLLRTHDGDLPAPATHP